MASVLNPRGLWCRIQDLPEDLAGWTTRWAGSTQALVLATFMVVVWVVGGFFVGFDDVTYQLYINTGTTIVTFLMVFLIQRSQNKESVAVHLKLNELLAATRGASNSLINIETHREREVQQLHKLYDRLVAEDSGGGRRSHSIEDVRKE